MSTSVSDIDARVPFSWEDREPLLELDFDEPEYRGRLARIQAAMAAQELDALLVYGGGEDAPANVRYVSGFFNWWGDTFVAIPRNGDPVLLTNAIFHGEPLHSNVQTTWLRDVRPLLHRQTTGTPRSITDLIGELLREWQVDDRRIGLADTYHVPARIDGGLRAQLPRASFTDASAIFHELRAIKSEAELEVVRELGRVTTAGLDAAVAVIRPGATESEVSAALVAGCLAAGAETASCFVSAGTRSFMKNIYPLPGKTIQAGELVSIDVTARVRGYRSDTARVVPAGAPPAAVVPMLEACLDAHDVGARAVRPGADAWSVVAQMRETIAAHGLAEWDWSTSHGGGLELNEIPHFHPGARALEAGMTFYLEPMIVPTHVGTICIEDMVIVTDGGVEIVTTSPTRTW